MEIYKAQYEKRSLLPILATSTVHTRMMHWVKGDVLDKVFAAFQQRQTIQTKLEAASLDGMIVKVRPDLGRQ